MRAKLGVLLGISAICCCSAQQTPKRWAPPNLYVWGDAVPKATIPREMVTSLTISGTKIVLEKTSLEKIAKKFGATLGQSGDASTALGWACLNGTDTNGRFALWLESDEMDGPSIGEFDLVRLSASNTLDARCVNIKGSFNGIQTAPLTLRLGMEEALIHKILGKPTETHGNTQLFSHEHNLVLRRNTYTSDNEVLVVLTDGKVSAIEVSQLTSD
jgi:hypothetical protein